MVEQLACGERRIREFSKVRRKKKKKGKHQNSQEHNNDLMIRLQMDHMCYMSRKTEPQIYNGKM